MSTEREQIGACTLYRGDCYAFLETLDVDCVLTDPPWSAITHAGARGDGFHQRRLLTFDSFTENDAVHLAEILCTCSRGWVVMTMDWRHATVVEQERPALFIRAGIWVKPNGAPQFTGDRPGTGWESIVMLHRPGRKWWNGGGQHAVWTIPRVVGAHPTEKPVPLLRSWVDQFSNPGETVCDPFMGSGTTGVACVQRGRSFIGIEREQQYFDMACKRISAAYAQPDLFIEQAAPAQQTALFAKG